VVKKLKRIKGKPVKIGQSLFQEGLWLGEDRQRYRKKTGKKGQKGGVAHTSVRTNLSERGKLKGAVFAGQKGICGDSEGVPVKSTIKRGKNLQSWQLGTGEGAVSF